MEEIQGNIYNSSTWKALGLTYVDYPSGKNKYQIYLSYALNI